MGFDCSGLVQAAYRAAGISLPRTAQAQFDAGQPVPAGTPLQPGDLVFFGRSATDVTHVGIYAGSGEMVDAPHASATARVQPTPTARGAPWGTDVVVGFTDPALGSTEVGRRR